MIREQGTGVPSGWQRVDAAGVSLDVPAGVVTPAGEESDGTAVTFVGDQIRIILDASPFADLLTRYESHPEFETHREKIGDETLDVVSFRAPHLTRVVGARLPGRLTAVLHIGEDVEMETALKILRSIRSKD